MLAVIDVSGTMRGAVPSAGGASRMDITKAAATQGLSLFGDDWAVGLWIFSTNMGGGLDYKELVKIGPLSASRNQLIGALQGVQVKRRGDTGLYDTVLAGYKNVQDGWQAGRINSMVILTDGIGNDDPEGGIELPGLLDQLGKIKDDKRPVQVIIIGLGDAINRGPLDQIVRATGGGVFVAEDPAKIGEIFLRAISLRPSQPR
jgi:Ca-activated chloride channel homolog